MSNAVKPSDPYVRRSTLADCTELAAKMRQEDVQEIWHLNRVKPLDALLSGLAWPYCYTVVHREKVVAMFGVGGYGRQGYPWMLASEGLKDIRKSFVRECRKYVAEMASHYPVLSNVAWSKNVVHIKWLQWLGFTLGEALPCGPDRELFVHFRKETQ